MPLLSRQALRVCCLSGEEPLQTFEGFGFRVRVYSLGFRVTLDPKP